MAAFFGNPPGEFKKIQEQMGELSSTMPFGAA